MSQIQETGQTPSIVFSFCSSFNSWVPHAPLRNNVRGCCFFFFHPRSSSSSLVGLCCGCNSITFLTTFTSQGWNYWNYNLCFFYNTCGLQGYYFLNRNWILNIDKSAWVRMKTNPRIFRNWQKFSNRRFKMLRCLQQLWHFIFNPSLSGVMFPNIDVFRDSQVLGHDLQNTYMTYKNTL